MENKEQKEVKLVPAICTQCGGKLEVDPSQEAAVCKFCGSAFIVEKAINNYTVQNAKIEHADHVTIDLKGSVDSVLGFAERELDKSRADRAVKRKLEAENSKQMMSTMIKMMIGMMILAIVMWIIMEVFNLW